MIAVFGASVTQQKDGYATRIGSLLGMQVKIYGYGGMHITDAGLCYIDKIVRDRPEFCFVDWFSTAYNSISKTTIESIDTMIYRFSKIKCKLVFLFFPFQHDHAKEAFYSFCKAALTERQMTSIDVREDLAAYELTSLLRDSIHTTEYGSELYSKIIVARFVKIRECISIPKNPPSTKYVRIRKKRLERSFDTELAISGTCEILGFELTIGPHSGVVHISGNGFESRTINTWDSWCHYSRKNFNISISLTGDVIVKILQDHFDTSSSRRQYDFSNEKKSLIVHNIFYIGKRITVRNLMDGDLLRNLPIPAISVVEKAVNYLKKALT